MSDAISIEPSIHLTPDACVVDLTPPVFAGIASLAAQVNGSLLASWLAATDTTAPISYEIYIQKATATGLFTLSNVVAITRALTFRIFQDAAGDLLEKDATYFVGVRALDGVGNRDTNTVSLSAMSEGVLEDDLAALVIELDGIADAMAGAVSTEFVATLEEDSLQAISENETELYAILECEE